MHIAAVQWVVEAGVMYRGGWRGEWVCGTVSEGPAVRRTARLHVDCTSTTASPPSSASASAGWQCCRAAAACRWVTASAAATDTASECSAGVLATEQAARPRGRSSTAQRDGWPPADVCCLTTGTCTALYCTAQHRPTLSDTIRHDTTLVTSWLTMSPQQDIRARCRLSLNTHTVTHTHTHTHTHTQRERERERERDRFNGYFR